MRNRGVVVIFVLLTLIPLLGLIGLLVDVGRYFILSRQLQNAADSTALAGATMLRSCNPANTLTVPHNINSCPNDPANGWYASNGGWVAVKPLIADVISSQRIFEVDVSNFYYRSWDMGNATKLDSERWNNVGYDGSASDITVIVNRWHECYSPASCDQGQGIRSIQVDTFDFGNPRLTPVQVAEWAPSDKLPSHNCAYTKFRDDNVGGYCTANAVTVSVRHERGLTFFFARLFMPGFDERMHLERNSTAVMRYPWCHGLPDCQETRRLDPDYTGNLAKAMCPDPNSGGVINTWPNPPALPWPTPTASLQPTPTP
ncbi:MAG: hypothetical protein GYA55_05930 [SAR324 cluster bacterium]|uniref:Putative Flp pilus-assembly TadG-like N-terminal domain-containing protein n=1 Tax=SAR324 cluster bacterium TaxID=2024889 RepID=A0A7X9FRW4_9DELT|nr:hypothetical protein [SAR324 cluster bacterium]